MEPVARKTFIAGISPARGGRQPHRRKHRVAVIAFDGVVLGDLAIPLEIFGRVRDAEERACYDVRVCGTADRVESEYLRLSLRLPWRLSWAAQADTIVVPGMDDLERTIPTAILRALRNALKSGARIASICTGAFILRKRVSLMACAQPRTGEPLVSWPDAIRAPRWMPMCSTWTTAVCSPQPEPPQAWICACISSAAITARPSPPMLPGPR